MSLVTKVINYGYNAVYVVDSEGKVHQLPPTLSKEGAMYTNPNRYFANRIIANSYTLLEEGRMRDEFVDSVLTYRKENVQYTWTPMGRGTPIGEIPQAPTEAEQSVLLATWRACYVDFNLALFGCEEEAARFAASYKTFWDYLMVTQLGTKFDNTLHFSIINCTGKTLYAVDDTIVPKLGRADILAIPTGDDSIFPDMWDQEKNCRALLDEKGISRYLRIQRFGSTKNEETLLYQGFSRGIAKEWKAEELTKEGFMYIPSYHLCLFDSEQKAQAFIDTYRSVEGYLKKKSFDELYEAAIQEAKSHSDLQKDRNADLLKGCGLLLGVGALWKLGEIIIPAIKAKKEETVPSSECTVSCSLDGFDFGNVAIGDIMFTLFGY
jgi:hypothetical protein